jgi:hypothetical protein
VSELAAHPSYDRAYRIYRNAVIDWHASGVIQSAARTLGMSARAYADGRLTANQFQWTSNSTNEPFTREHLDHAYQQAVNDVCGVLS